MPFLLPAAEDSLGTAVTTTSQSSQSTGVVAKGERKLFRYLFGEMRTRRRL